MRKSVVTLNLGLYWYEQRERAKGRRLVRGLGARGNDVGLNRRVVVGRLRRVMAFLQPAPRVTVHPLLGMPRRDIRESLLGCRDPVRDCAVRPDVRLANGRGIRRYREKQTRRQHSQHEEDFPFQR